MGVGILFYFIIFMAIDALFISAVWGALEILINNNKKHKRYYELRNVSIVLGSLILSSFQTGILLML